MNTTRHGSGTGRNPSRHGHGSLQLPDFSGSAPRKAVPGVLSVIDLCSGLGGFSEAFIRRGHAVRRVDIDPSFAEIPHTEIWDVMDMVDISGYDIVLASPPCQAFSVASIGHHWGGGKGAYRPKTETAKLSIRLAEHIFRLCRNSGAMYFIENPRGLMRKMPFAKPDTATGEHTANTERIE